MMEPELIKALINAGVGALIAGIILFGIYCLANKFGSQFLNAQINQVVAIERLTKAIEDSTSKDNSEHREMIIMLKVISEKIERFDNGS